MNEISGGAAALPATGGNTMNDCSAALEAKRKELLQAGVWMMDPSAVYVEETVTVGAGTRLLPGTILMGNTVVGKNCRLGPNTMLTDCTVGDGVTVNASQAEDSRIEDDCQIGPYTHIRPHCVVGKGSKIGAFVQLKNCNLGEGTKMAHLTYVGDSDVGKNVNFGCGTVTVNYDRAKKYRTVIEDSAFIGCNTNLIAPVRVGEGAYIAAGSTITDDIPAMALSIARARQQNKKDWASKHKVKEK